MTQFRSGVARLGVLALTAGVAAGCDTVSPAGTGNVQVTMQKIASAAATQALVDGLASVADGSYVPIDLDNVISFTVEITSIELLEDGEDGSWIPLDIDPMLVDLDLKALPAGGALPLILATGSVLGGSYQSIRLPVSGGTIMFQDAVPVGEFTFAGTPEAHLVTVPSGVLKTDMAFTVDVDGSTTTVNLLFDEFATFQNATTTGSGKVILAPVLRNASGDGGS